MLSTRSESEEDEDIVLDHVSSPMLAHLIFDYTLIYRSTNTPHKNLSTIDSQNPKEAYPLTYNSPSTYNSIEEEIYQYLD